MFLQTTVIGNLGKDAHITEHNGKKVINFSVAHTESYKNAQDVAVDKTTWVECAMWENVNVAPYLKKGTLVHCIGTPKSAAYVSKDGEVKSSLKLGVITLKLLSSAKKDNAAPVSKTEVEPVVINGVDDDLPF